MILTRRAALRATMSALGGAVVLPGRLHAAGEVTGPDPHVLTHDPDQPVLGNPDGDVTLVAFFDYQCPYCRKATPELTGLVGDDGNIRLVMKDWPIFGPVSDHAVEIALGSVKLGRYSQVHAALMAIRGRLDKPTVDAVARKAGVDPAEAMASFRRDRDRWSGLIARNDQQAQLLGLPGTPAYVVGLDVFLGVTPVDDLRRAVATACKG
ncbi:MAG: DsbA family protein [Mangrovicoccus sp.]|nr:DsbA family protein [Mangrovicoccus sp.]